MLISQYIYDPHYLRRRTLGVDAWGIGMLVVGMGALQIMLDKGQEKDWFGSSLICWLCVVAAAGLTAFVVRELRAKDPIVHFKLLRSRTFASGVVLVTIMGFVLTGSLVLLPLYMQTLLGWTATTAGIWNSPRGIGTALCMPAGGVSAGQGMGRAPLADLRLCPSGGLLLRLCADDPRIRHLGHLLDPDLPGLRPRLPVRAAGHADHESDSQGGDSYATSLFNTVRNIGSSMGISFVTTLLARRGQFHQQILGDHITPSSAVGQQALARLAPFMAHQGSDPVTAA